MNSLTLKDQDKLLWLMKAYSVAGMKVERPILVEHYEEGLLCLRHESGSMSGRCLFFTILSKPVINSA